MTQLLDAWTLGLILSLLALGVFISFRVFSFPDITPDGSITLGAVVAAVCLVRGVNPLAATLAGFAAGTLAGAVTGILHTKFGINGLLSGILVMTALYSINLGIMHASNIPLGAKEVTLSTYAERLAKRVWGETGGGTLGVWKLEGREIWLLCFMLSSVAVVAVLLYLFFRTNLGTAMRASGDNAQMIRALGVDVGNMTILGLALANGLVGLAGALLAQYLGFADVQMGIGMLVTGLASVIIGEALVGSAHLGLVIVGTIMGAILFRMLIAMALRMGMDAAYLKLATAVFVFVALILPDQLRKLRKA